MIGQGRPRTSRIELFSPDSHCRQTASGRLAVWVLLVTALVVMVRSAGAETAAGSYSAASAASGSPQEARSETMQLPNMRVRLAWGGGAGRQWHGEVRLTEGQFGEPLPLGIDADEPGSMWRLPGGRAVRIRQPSARTYDAVDLPINAPLSAELHVEFTPADNDSDGDASPRRASIPLDRLVGETHSEQLDRQGNRLFLRRSPGDVLRVAEVPDSLVFATGERFETTVKPHLLPVPEGAKVLLNIELRHRPGGSLGEGQMVWSEEHEFRAGTPTSIPIAIRLPGVEGVCELTATAMRTGWPNPVRRPLEWQQTIAQRKVQMVVVSPREPQAANVGAGDEGGPGEFRTVVEIDPANPKWWELLGKLPRLPNMSRMPNLPKLPNVDRFLKGPLGNGQMRTEKHPLGELVRLNPNRAAPDASWQAYALPVESLGRPHVLEVDYPSDVAQTLGISVLEPNSSGAMVPIGLDSGVEVPPSALDQETPAAWRRHRLIFWPRTGSPMVLLYNMRDEQPAVYGKIRVLAGPEHLPPARTVASRGGRRLAAYMDRPLLPENFSAPEAFDAHLQRGLDDWATFYLAGTRLVEYLDHAGYGGMMLGVLADGSTVYPSDLLQPTPRHDTGPLFSTGQDPVRKDVLEMLCRLFTRRGLTLVPSLDFSAPLPSLEQRLRHGGPETVGLQWIGPGGETWSQTYPKHRGMAAYYNVLHPEVQQTMLAVVRELVTRYGRHRSFGGLGIRMTAYGYAQLPGPEWGVDDATIRRFTEQTHIRVPGEGPDRFAHRARFLSDGPQRDAWLKWRAEQLADFHRRMRAELAAVRPEAELYLAGTQWFASEGMTDVLRPTLDRRRSARDAFLRAGIDAEAYGQNGLPVLLRPRRLSTRRLSTLGAIDREIALAHDFDRTFRAMPTRGALWYHPPEKTRLPSFEQQCPYQPCYASLFAQPVPSGEANRRRFAHTLAAADSSVIFDGGWTLPMGQESSVAAWWDAYRRLPAVAFETADGATNDSQPVVFRYATLGSETYAYAVNDAPFPVDARVMVDGPSGCRVDELTGCRRIEPPRPRPDGPSVWHVQLEPYELVAVRFSSPGVRLIAPGVDVPKHVARSLERRVNALGRRAAALHAARAKPLLGNPGFEQLGDGRQRIPGWLTTQGREGVDVRLDDSRAHTGKRSAHLHSDGPIAVLASRRFRIPATGRLSVSVWLRVDDPARQPPLRLALEGDFGRLPYRYAPVGAAIRPGEPSNPIGAEWSQFVFPVTDLPLEPGCEASVRLDLMGPGRVWVDDVEVFDLALNRAELLELSKLITLIDVKRQNGQVADCLHLLNGHWPQLLERHVAVRSPDPHDGLAEHPDHQRSEPRDKAPATTGLLDRMKGLWPKKWW